MSRATPISHFSLCAAMFLLSHGGCDTHERGADGDAAVYGDAEVDSDGDAEGSADKDPARDCDPDAISLISAKTSPVIGTVGIIEWSTVMNPVTSASIEFGLNTEYGYTATVDLNEPDYRTLLLGMKPSSVYHYRIVVNGCEGADHTIETGALRDEPTDTAGVFGTDSSEVLELSLDLSAETVGETWRYKSGSNSFALGDVQRIAKGNTLVTYSSAGEIHEVSPAADRVRVISVDGLGYANWRPTLYGEPSRY